jgi:hypothetical protein
MRYAVWMVVTWEWARPFSRQIVIEAEDADQARSKALDVAVDGLGADPGDVEIVTVRRMDRCS